MRYVAIVPVLLATACGGSKAASGGGGGGVAANAPEWVNRGSRVEKGSIFGVGSASGIKNNDLARTTAANRGRAEISKILEVYSASLMKDYQESVSANGKSSEAQMVTQAVKTFSAQLMNGTEPREYWLDPGQNTWYVLVELNFERAKEAAAAKSDMDNTMKDWVDKNGGKVLDDMDKDSDTGPVGRDDPPADDNANEEPPPAQRPPEKKPPVATTPPDEGPVVKKGGPPPGWTNGQCNSEKYLCGVGDGPDRRAADMDARAELARIFQSNITSVAKSFEGATRQISSKTGETWQETQNVSQFSMVTTEKVVTMSEILERWDDGKGRMWSLAVIDRAQASAALRDQIQTKDSIVGSQLDRAKNASDALAKLKSLKSAAAALAEREALNSDLRVINKSGQGVPSPHDIGEILALLEGAAAELKIGIAISGSGGDKVQNCLEQALTAKGYQVEANTSEEEDEDPDVSGSFDVLIKVSVKNEKRDKIAGQEVVNTTVTLKLINGKTNKILRTFTGSEKASRPSVQAAASTSAFKVCQKQVPSIVSDIDRYFSK
jgi:hypothetical protein